MHRTFRKALDTAVGKSHSAIAVVVDVRGFSSFSQARESFDTSVFLKRMYTSLIDNYFPFSAFYKSTGDGLLIIVPFTADTLKDACVRTIDSCIKCHDEFENITKGDPMVNFDVPEKVGIGVARGPVSCLVSKRRILDYSGRILNLSSRLSEIARPSGVVIDGNFGMDLLPDKQKSCFKEEKVYLPGIAEVESVEVFITEKYTEVPALNKTPFGKIRWETVEDEQTLQRIQKTKRYFRYWLAFIPSDPRKITVRMTYPKFENGKRVEGVCTYHDCKDFKYELEAGKPIVRVNYSTLAQVLERAGVSLRTKVLIRISYPQFG